MKPIFVQLQCTPGKTYEVADAIYKTDWFPSFTPPVESMIFC